MKEEDNIFSKNLKDLNEFKIKSCFYENYEYFKCFRRIIKIIFFIHKTGFSLNGNIKLIEMDNQVRID